MKILIGLQIIMGIVRKPTLASYWAEDELTETPSFRKYMSRNRFQSLLANLHFDDSETQTREQRAAADAAAQVAGGRRGVRTRGGRGRGRGRGTAVPAAANPPPARGGRGGRGGRAGLRRGQRNRRGRAANAEPEPEPESEAEAEAEPETDPDPHSVGPRPRVYDVDEDGVDKLKKIRPLLDMVDRNFLKYKPKRELALDEGGCPFKGRLKFRTYCPNKPNRYCIKTYQLCESQTGYCVSFDIYTGKGDDDYEQVSHDAGQTTNLVCALLRKANCSKKGHHLYMDNYYNSPQLCDELEERKTHCIGTLNFNRKETPKCLGKVRKVMNPKGRTQDRGKVSFRRRRNTLVLVWKDKCSVTTISTLHKAEMRNQRVHYRGYMVQKPVVVLDYSDYMYGVDLCDQRLQYYHWLRKTVKWWRKMSLHIINMCMLNANILHNKFASKKMSSEVFRKFVATCLLKEGEAVSNATPQRRTPLRVVSPNRRIVPGSHFLRPIPGAPDVPGVPARKKNPQKRCKLCAKRKKRSCTRYWCEQCKVALCLYPCFEIFHTKTDISQDLNLQRQNSNDSGRSSQPNSQEEEDDADYATPLPESPE